VKAIINRSSIEVEVHGKDAAGEPRTFRLEPGKQTADDFEAVAVRAVPWSLSEVFDSGDWWEVFTNETYVYAWGPDWPPGRNLILHCVPFKRETGVARILPGYAPAPEGLVHELELSPAAQRDPVHPTTDRDGEIRTSHYVFGKFVRTRQYITVRLAAHGVGLSAPLKETTSRWKLAIESTWNTSLKPDGSEHALEFECDWESPSPHFRIGVAPANSGLRANFHLFFEDCSDEVVAHEFGHYLGFTDYYVYHGEVPKLADRIQMDLAPSERVTINPADYFWRVATFGNNDIRARERLEITATPLEEEHIMESNDAPVTKAIVNAIFTGDYPKLYWHKRFIEQLVGLDYISILRGKE
jgi:hypothetical protein